MKRLRNAGRRVTALKALLIAIIIVVVIVIVVIGRRRDPPVRGAGYEPSSISVLGELRDLTVF